MNYRDRFLEVIKILSKFSFRFQKQTNKMELDIRDILHQRCIEKVDKEGTRVPRSGYQERRQFTKKTGNRENEKVEGRHRETDLARREGIKVSVNKGYKHRVENNKRFPSVGVPSEKKRKRIFKQKNRNVDNTES